MQVSLHLKILGERDSLGQDVAQVIKEKKQVDYQQQKCWLVVMVEERVLHYSWRRLQLFVQSGRGIRICLLWRSLESIDQKNLVYKGDFSSNEFHGMYGGIWDTVLATESNMESGAESHVISEISANLKPRKNCFNFFGGFFHQMEPGFEQKLKQNQTQ